MDENSERREIYRDQIWRELCVDMGMSSEKPPARAYPYGWLQ